MWSKDTCFDLLAADSEAAVGDIVKGDDALSAPGNWKPLDDRETNFNVTSNQASDGGKALTELMTNMVDAVLMKAAQLKGVDPKGPEAPRTMYEAVDSFVKNLYGGKLVNLDRDDPWLRDYSQKNLVIGITGARRKDQGLPCYTFVDNGEGQRPDNFEMTFLSLSVGNKKSIPFVQGKYNMGSSGVLRYCGRNWYKLILSRRYDRKSPWGWTLIRRRPSDAEDLPIAEYFVLPSGIPSFEAEFLYPFSLAGGKRYDGMHLSTGTVVKLYDYQLGSRFVSFRGAREALNENLVETILPFRLLDFRQMPATARGRKAAAERGGERGLGIDPRPFYGMEFLLLRSHRETGLMDDEEEVAAEEGRINVGKVTDPELGEISISAIVLKRLPGWLDERQRINRVFHAVNGQVQFKQTRGYLSQSCKLPALKDRVVVFVDASRLTFYAHNEVWKGDREHISNTLLGERYKDKVTETIRESQALKDLQNRIAEQELERATKAESNSLFQRLVDADRNLATLLSDRDPVVRLPASGGMNGSDRGKGEFEGKFNPTFVRFEEKFFGHSVNIPINKSRPIAARTDAENGYLDRFENCGRILLPAEVRTKFAVREHLHNGRLTVYLEPLEGKLSVGNTIRIKLGLKDDAMPSGVETREIEICIADEVTSPPPPPNNEPKKPWRQRSGDGNGREGDGQDAPTHGLPKCILLTNDGREVQGYSVEPWPEGFSENDGGTVADLGENEVIYKINYDNAYHINYRKQQRGQIAKDVVTEKYILGMRILMLGFEHAFRSAKSENGADRSVEEFADEFRKMAARGAASTVLALAENLPKIVDRSAIDHGDE